MSYLLYLRSFVSVYRHSSISRAASALSLTQPAVSRHVKLLEGRLGATLFTRLPRGLAPTPAAVELERQAGPHLDALEGMLDARGAGGALAGVAHVGATSGFIALLLPALAGLHRRGLRVDLRAMPPPALLSALAERVIDVAVTPARIPHKGVEYQLLHECPQRLVCAPQWSGRLPKSAAPRGLPLIDQQGPAAPLTPYWKQVYARDPEAPALVLPDYQTALDAARAGAGLAVAPECLCRDALRAGQLVAAPQARRPPSFALYAARAKGPLSERARYCLERLTEAAARW
ncbi:LysR family transcriptional regulator [Achromobacter sp. 413638]|uniref:LysR family transcriptional regulator n=1 Tax=Achromobacter sp. 413638 TaxID=3342385 RepID=UPI0032473ABE